jgi:hypothetical protein
VRFPSGIAFLVSALGALGALIACSGSSSGPSSSPSDAAPAVCTDSLSSVFAKSQCPANAMGEPADYDTAITTTCGAQGLKLGDIQFGQCLDYLVWEQDNDAAGTSFSKCFYDVKSHALVGIVFADGMQDQCGNKSLTVQGGAGAADASCKVSGLTVGGGGNYQSCAPEPEGGADAASE